MNSTLGGTTLRSPTDRLPLAVSFLPACFLIEVILGGPFGIYGGISVRLLLLAASCCILLFAVLLRRRVVRPHVVPIFSILAFLVLNGLWIAIVPVVNGTKMYWSLREGHAFIVFVPVVLTLALLRRSQLTSTVSRLQRIVVVTSLVLAAFQVGIWLVGTLLGELSWAVPLVLGWIFPGAAEQLHVYPMADGFFRVFWISTLWCILGFFWFPVAFPHSRLRWVWRGLLLFDLFVAYSRGIWIGLLAGQVVASLAILSRRNFGRMLTRSAMAGALGVAAFAGILIATGSLDRGVSRFKSTTSREDISITQRIEQAPYLLNLWYDHPIIGSGYGAYARNHVRSEEAPYSYEHMPYALLAKLGIVGVVTSGVFVAGWALTAWQLRGRAPVQVASFLGSCAALVIAEMTNPLVLNFVSMTIYACLIFQWADIASPSDLEDRLHV